jgi:hypothetical protein
VCRPPLNWIFVKPCSGARRATWTQQHAHRFACRIGRLQSLAHEPGAATRTESGVPAPVELDLCKTVFGGSPCCLDTTTRSTFRVPYWAPPMAWIFVVPCSGARRAAWTQQHAQRFACLIGRQSLAHEP